MKLCQGRFMLVTRQRFVTQKVICHWNKVPREVVTEPSLMELKKQLNGVLRHTVILGWFSGLPCAGPGAGLQWSLWVPSNSGDSMIPWFRCGCSCCEASTPQWQKSHPSWHRATNPVELGEEQRKHGHESRKPSISFGLALCLKNFPFWRGGAHTF